MFNLSVLFHWFIGASFMLMVLKWQQFVKNFSTLRRVFLRDIYGARRLVLIQFYLVKFRLFNLSVIDLFHKTVEKKGDKVGFRIEDESWTFKQMDIYTNRVANYFKSIGYKKGDEVSLLMENRIEYIGIWLGLAKIGVVPAFINTNQKDKALVHAIYSVDSTALIFSGQFTDTVTEVVNELNATRKLDYFIYDGDSNSVKFEVKDLKAQIEEAATTRPNHKCQFTDKLYYIYTSGTTGYPKASVIKHFRFMFGAVATFISMQLKHDDVLYSPLPIYHSVAGLVGTGLALVQGITLVLKPKFSASQFWLDCKKYDITCVQYVGELCRYLLSQPERPIEREHKVRLFFGNGLRKTFWRPMKERFNLERLIEFFGSTEGNASLINFSNKEGACGFLPFIYPKFLVQRFYPLHLVKYDRETDSIIRDEEGYCIPCQPGENGMLVSMVGTKDPLKTFDGYTNKEETEKKMISQVFLRDDKAFITGDLMFSDEDNFLYFADRVGDTFRWKGENVSTTEVENIISSMLDYKECVVIGVELPGHEGKAGMLVLTNEELHLSLNELLAKMKEKLPTYSIPVFVRLASKLDTTGTFKFQKTKLKKEGFNIEQISDPLYVLDVKSSCYRELDKKIYEDIQQCNVRF